MVKLFGVSIKVIISYLFNWVTCYYFIYLFRITMPFSDTEIDKIKIAGSILVAVFASLYWIIKGINSLVELPYKKRERRIRERISELEEIKKRMEIMSEMTKEDIDKILKNDK